MTVKELPSKVKKKAHLQPLSVQLDEAKSDNLYRKEADTYQDEVVWNPVAEMMAQVLKILPENIIQQLEAIGEIDSQNSWVTGDLANEIYTRMQSNDTTKSYTYNDACWFTAKIVNTKSYSTVKGYAITARRFVGEVREAFAFRDIPFSHFEYAGQVKFEEVNPKTGNPYWKDILSYSYNQSLVQGKRIPEVELRREFEGKVSDPNKTGYKLGKHPNIVTPPVNQVSYITPQEQMQVAQLPLGDLKNYVANRLELIVGELSGLSMYVVGQIPSFPSQQFQGAILMFSEVIKRLR